MKLKEKMKNSKHTKFDKKKLIGTVSKKHIKNGSYTMVMSVIFIAVVVVINMIVSAIPSKYSEIDISSEKLYSIGDDTKAMLKDLDKDVTIYQIAQSGSEDENITNLLKKYEDESKHIKVEQKDPVVNPKFVAEYTSDDLSANSLIVVCGDRNKVIDYNNIYESTMDYQTYSYQTTGFDGEGQITSAIGYVTSEDLPVLYTLEGHGEKEMDSSIKEDIEKANMDIQSLNLLTESSVPDDADCLFIDSPSTDISEDEKNAIIVVDGAQSTPHMPVNVQDLDADFFAFSGHKIFGPMGIGVLYGKKKLLKKMPPFLSGGEMIESVTRESAKYAELPHKFEAGTVNAAGAIALHAAIKYAQSVGFDVMQERELAVTKRAFDGLKELPHVHVLGSDRAEEHTGILTFTIDDVHPHDVSEILIADGICVRAGHHCAQPLLNYLGISSATRASFMFYNTEEEADKFVAGIASIRERMGYGK